MKKGEIERVKERERGRERERERESREREEGWEGREGLREQPGSCSLRSLCVSSLACHSSVLSHTGAGHRGLTYSRNRSGIQDCIQVYSMAPRSPHLQAPGERRLSHGFAVCRAHTSHIISTSIHCSSRHWACELPSVK